MNTVATKEILLIEDEEADIEIISEVLQSEKYAVKLSIAHDGNHVLESLQKRVESSETLPNLIILDLNLPGKNGFEVLQGLKNDSSLRTIPVLIMTSSGDQRDVNRVYQMNANSYVQKSLSYEDFRAKVKQLSEFWFDASRLPFQPA